MGWFDEQRRWYSYHRHDIYYLKPEQVNLLEDIVRGKVPSEQLPENLRVNISGYHLDYDRSCAAEMLLVRNLETSLNPVINWVKDLGSDRSKRHWTNCETALNCVSTLMDADEKYKSRFKEEIIPALKEIALDGDPKQKYVSGYAITLIRHLGGPEAEQALVFIRDNSPDDSDKWYAYTQLRDHFGHPKEEEMIPTEFRNGKPVAWMPRHKSGYGPTGHI